MRTIVTIKYKNIEHTFRIQKRSCHRKAVSHPIHRHPSPHFCITANPFKFFIFNIHYRFAKVKLVHTLQQIAKKGCPGCRQPFFAILHSLQFEFHHLLFRTFTLQK